MLTMELLDERITGLETQSLNLSSRYDDIDSKLTSLLTGDNTPEILTLQAAVDGMARTQDEFSKALNGLGTQVVADLAESLKKDVAPLVAGLLEERAAGILFLGAKQTAGMAVKGTAKCAVAAVKVPFQVAHGAFRATRWAGKGVVGGLSSLVTRRKVDTHVDDVQTEPVGAQSVPA